MCPWPECDGRRLCTGTIDSYAAGMDRLVEARPPVIAAIGERLLKRVDRMATELTDVIRRAEPFYYSSEVVPVDDLRTSVRNNLVDILGQLAGRPSRGYEASRATGRRRAEQGAPLPVILHAYRIAGKYIWAAILAEASEEDGAATALLHASSELWFIIDDQSGSVSDAYRDAVAERARTDSQTRSAMLDVLLRGDVGDGSRLWDCAAALGLPHNGTFVVVAAATPLPGIESIPHADDVLRTRDVQSAWRVEVDAQVGVVVLTQRIRIDRVCAHLTELAGGPVGLSEPYPSLDQTPAALRQARLALATANRGTQELVRYEQVPVAVLIASAPEAATTVARTILAPVLALPATECYVLLDTLRAWFSADGATSVAAAELHVHRNTVRYRLRRLEELTGQHLSQPTGVAQLYLALEAARILDLGP